MKILRLSPFSCLLVSLLLAPAAFAQKHDATADAGRSAFYTSRAWQELLATPGSAWRVDWCPATGTPRALYGSGLDLVDWRGNSLEEARRHALRQLRERSALLGLGTSEFRESIGTRMGRTWSFTFDQFYRGLPVIGGRADVRVSMAGRIAMLGSTAWQVPADFDVTPAIAPETATAIAWQTLAVSPNAAANALVGPRLVIWGDVHAATPQTPRLAYEVAIRNLAADGSGEIGRTYVDAKTGTVLRYENDKHQCGPNCHHAGNGGDPANPIAAPTPTTLQVLSWTRTGLDATAPAVQMPMPGLQVQVPGHGTYVTDDQGRFTVDLQNSAIVNLVPFDGLHHGPVQGPNAPNGLFQLIPGVSGYLYVSGSGASVNEQTHSTVSFWVDRSNEFVRSVLGDSPQLAIADDVALSVNINLQCNAFYNGNSLNFYGAGGGCLNMAQSTIIAHEWGHGLDDRYGGISQVNGLSEGWADIVSMYLTDDPVIGLNYRGSGTQIRTATNTRQFPSGNNVHEKGETWMGFAWKLRERLAGFLGRPTAIAVTNEIVLGTIVANASDQTAAVLEVFLADDVDGNLLNGTPHAADLIWACQQHSLPYPAPAGLANDDCAYPFELQNGLNGPFSNTGATSGGPTFQCASGGNDVWFTYLVGSAGTLDVSTCGQTNYDTLIEVFTGSCGNLVQLACNDDSCASLASQISVAVQPGVHLIRVGGYNSLTGNFNLQVSGPQGFHASRAPFGTACGGASRSFYQIFPSNTFDLAATSMQLVKSGDRYHVQAGGSYQTPPGSALVAPLGDDDEVNVNIGLPMPIPGGTTTSLTLCSNGYLSAAAGNSLSPTPSESEWLSSPQMRWGCWHDFDPTAAGSGQIKVHFSGSLVVFTWDGVWTYDTNQTVTMQLQFDLTTGDVTYAWPAMPSLVGAFLVGYAGSGQSVDLGNRDLSVAVPAGFSTSDVDLVPPQLTSTFPQVGSTLVFTSTFTSPTSLGLQLLGLQRLDPGTPLDGFGLPGCRQHASADAVLVLIPNAGQATYSMAIPADTGLLGLPLAAQTAALSPASNATGLSFSRGLALVVGL
jgi:hypothetical protein